MKHSVPGRVDLGGLALGQGISPHIFLRETGAGRGIDCYAGYNEKHGFEEEPGGSEQTISRWNRTILVQSLEIMLLLRKRLNSP